VTFILNIVGDIVYTGVELEVFSLVPQTCIRQGKGRCFSDFGLVAGNGIRVLVVIIDVPFALIVDEGVDYPGSFFIIYSEIEA